MENYKKWTVLENIKIEKLIFWWNWLAYDNNDINSKKIIIKWWVIPGSIINIRVLRNKKNYIEGQYIETISNWVSYLIGNHLHHPYTW